MSLIVLLSDISILYVYLMHILNLKCIRFRDNTAAYNCSKINYSGHNLYPITRLFGHRTRRYFIAEKNKICISALTSPKIIKYGVLREKSHKTALPLYFYFGRYKMGLIRLTSELILKLMQKVSHLADVFSRGRFQL